MCDEGGYCQPIPDHYDMLLRSQKKCHQFSVIKGSTPSYNGAKLMAYVQLITCIVHTPSLFHHHTLTFPSTITLTFLSSRLSPSSPSPFPPSHPHLSLHHTLTFPSITPSPFLPPSHPHLPSTITPSTSSHPHHHILNFITHTHTHATNHILIDS